MATIEQIRGVLNQHFSPKYNRQQEAFENMLMREFEGRVTEVFVREQIGAMIANGKLPPGQEWQEGWRGFYREAWMIEPCDANERLLLEALAKRGHPFSAESLLGLRTNTTLIRKLATTQKWRSQQNRARRDEATWKQEAESASNEAIEAAELESELLASWYKDGRLRWDADPRAFASAQVRVKSLTLEQLRAEVATKREKKRLRDLPKEELQAILKSVETARKQVLLQKPEVPSAPPAEIPVPPGKLRIPALYFPPGKLEGLSWSIRLYELLPAGERQRLIRTFGSDQIVAACNAAKVKQGAR